MDYEVVGPPDGRELLFVHGLTADRRSLSLPLEPMFEGLPGRWRRYYLDLPGHGASQGDPAAASADDLVAALGGFARAVCGGPPAVVAHSYGGYLAQGLARDLAAHLPGLFLLCPVVEPDFPRRRVAPERVLARDPELAFENNAEQSAFSGETVFHTADVLARWRAALESGHRQQDHAFVAAARARYVMARPHFRGLAELACPVTIVCGRDDAWAGFEDQLELVRAIRNATLIVLPRCGHLPQIEAPVALSSIFGRWLSEI